MVPVQYTLKALMLMCVGWSLAASELPKIECGGKVMTDNEVIQYFGRSPEEIKSLLSPGEPIDIPRPAICKITAEQFFAALKNPTSETLDLVKRVVYEDDEWRYGIDSETGLPPAGLIITRYAQATAEQKQWYREIYQYLLETGTNAAYNMENKKMTIDRDAVKDLQVLHDTYNQVAVRPWDYVIHRLENEPMVERQLSSVFAKLQHYLGRSQSPAPVEKPPLEKTATRSTWKYLLGAAVMAGAYYLFSSSDATNKKKQDPQKSVHYTNLYNRGIA